MYVSIGQIGQSLERLEGLHPFFGMSYLAFKRRGIPVGKTAEMVFARVAAEFLDEFYRPSSEYEGYYTPFQPSKKKSRWLSQEYNHKSLQRITTDTFGDATIHPKDASEWGWVSDYVQRLSDHLKGSRIPAFDLAVWLFRNVNWPKSVRPGSLVERLFSAFRIPDNEVRALFNVEFPRLADPWLSELPVTERELLRLIGRPPGSSPEEGAALELLELHEVGPTTTLIYKPSERLNIITGDNSLGKTFLLECVWWALTGDWLDLPAQPRPKSRNGGPSILFSIKTSEGTTQKYRSHYNWAVQNWNRPSNRRVLAGLVVYARHDGSFAIWDPAKVPLSESSPEIAQPRVLLDKKGLWDGVPVKTRFGEKWVCNGLLRDWVQWQIGGPRYSDQYRVLEACLEALSPSVTEPLRMGGPARLPFDTREIPTLVMPYGEVPVLLASAGVQRIIALAYILVWAWFEHIENSRTVRKSPERRLVLLIDEVEAHLHPRWQRAIVPALTEVIRLLSSELTPQVHLATHSPMVMASTETIFDEANDDLHHLKLVGGEVRLEELHFVKRGTVDQWLLSPVFELNQARSVPAERAIGEAKALQEMDIPPPGRVREVNSELTRVLAPDDDFWPRWRFFAKKHGHLR